MDILLLVLLLLTIIGLVIFISEKFPLPVDKIDHNSYQKRNHELAAENTDRRIVKDDRIIEDEDATPTILVPDPIVREESELAGKEINGITLFDLNSLDEIIGKKVPIRKEFMLNDGVVRFINIMKDREDFYISKFDEYNITTLYHFTDESNLQSIVENQGILSYRELMNRNINIKYLASSEFSRERDRSYGLDDFVRLSFTRNHPMMYAVRNEGRIPNPVILEIEAHLSFWDDTLYANKNAARNSVNIGGGVDDFEAIKFEVVTQPNHFNLSIEDKPFYQAEILVRNRVPLMFIQNLKIERV